ncbi:hypothetical protein [Sedimentisphaera salicampi]|uniref:hypothetical protein n=1 Tax=Sedimentisphaera salicampi TaxID=1941349 RepID=UPI000B9B7612|nr:hypothetical protein [Sedimentisphaera salicampi]OXU15729.1 hypothetical protein SMSP1_00516 [Sedimentisphaera salicampi]
MQTLYNEKIDRFGRALNNLPSSGGGLHTALLSAANYGAIAEIPASTIFRELRESTANGCKGRIVPDKEIQSAIDKAMEDYQRTDRNFSYRRDTRPAANVPEDYSEKLISQAGDISTIDLMEASSVRLIDNPENDWRLLIETLFNEQDYIFAGGKFDTETYQAGEYCRSGKPAEFLGLNPYQQGGSRRAADISEFRYCLLESDSLALKKQVKLISQMPLPIAAIIFSGNKSFHCWIDIRSMNITTIEGWNERIKAQLYNSRLAGMNCFDTATKAPSQMSRTPSHYRIETGKYQQLIYLNPEPDSRPIVE